MINEIKTIVQNYLNNAKLCNFTIGTVTADGIRISDKLVLPDELIKGNLKDYALVGDKVRLIRNHGGQEFYIVEIIGKISIQGEQGIQGEKGNTGIQGLQGIQGIQGIQGESGLIGDSKDNTVSFTEAIAEANIITGENHATLFGKILKSIKTFRTYIGALANLTTTIKTDLVSSINEVKVLADSAFQSASDGKVLISNAITGADNRVVVPTDATFQQLSGCIAQIETGINTFDATATASQILASMTAYINNIKVIGTMPNRNGAWSDATVVAYCGNGFFTAVPPEGYYSGDVANFANNGGVMLNDADFNPANFLATKNMFGLQGAIPVFGSEEYYGWRRATVSLASSSGRVRLSIPTGAYLVGGNNGLGVFCDDADFIPANILNTANLFGLQGTAVAGISGARGVVASSSTTLMFVGPAYSRAEYYVTINGLLFKPNIIIVRLYNATGAGSATKYSVTVYAQNPGYPGYQTVLAFADALNATDTFFNTKDLSATFEAYVTATGFRLPVGNYVTQYEWIALP